MGKKSGWCSGGQEMKRLTIADSMNMTQSLAKHVDMKTTKTAEIFEMMRSMVFSQNERIKILESKVESLLRNTSPNIADRVERLEERKK